MDRYVWKRKTPRKTPKSKRRSTRRAAALSAAASCQNMIQMMLNESMGSPSSGETSERSPATRLKKAPKEKPLKPSGREYNFDSDDDEASNVMIQEIKNKVDSMFNKFKSDDIDETCLDSATTSVPRYALSDSDDDIMMKSEPKFSDASCSSKAKKNEDLASRPCDSSSSINEPQSTISNDLDDIMAFADSIPDEDQLALKNNDLDDMKSLEEYRRETEEMLKKFTSSVKNLTRTDEVVEEKPEPPKSSEEKIETEETPKKSLGNCPICLESLSKVKVAATSCGHLFCKECITMTAKVHKKCPTCRKQINAKKIHMLYI